MTIATAMTNAIHDIGIARQIGTYSDAVEMPAHARWLFTAGTPGLAADGHSPQASRPRPSSPGSMSTACCERPA